MPLLFWLAALQVPVDGQPLAENVRRLVETLAFLNAPLPAATMQALEAPLAARDASEIEAALDPQVLVRVHINPESRVKAFRGAARADLVQAGHRAFLVKVVNEAASVQPLGVSSPQSGQVFGGPAELILRRMQREGLGEFKDKTGDAGRFLDVSIHRAPPMQPQLSGLGVEYVLMHVYSRDAGKREATLVFDVGQGTQDLGFRAEVPVLFDVKPAVPVRLSILDEDGTPTTARLTFRDAAGHVHPPQAKRLAPDFFFQEQVYRKDGDLVLLPPGRMRVTWSRGPEYHSPSAEVEIPSEGEARVEMRLKRWYRANALGWYSGDHHIHGSGCAHYTCPTEGVSPADLFANVKGEGLNVGCVLTWGPGFDAQRRFFSPGADAVSEPLTILKYDLEISGFGSQALGHVCLLGLKDQVYPGSGGTSTKGWPSWTLPVLRWTKAQGGVTGYPHTAMNPDGAASARAAMRDFDADKEGLLSRAEAGTTLLPEPFVAMDSDRDGALSPAEYAAAVDRRAGELPNLVLPSSVIEICVTTALGACDFTSAMNTARVPEWNTWYHLMNCGFPLKVSGETDFPCMSGSRVGAGRVYVKLGKVDRVEFPAWLEGVRAGRSYVSDGYAHAPGFTVGGVEPGGPELRLEKAGPVTVKARVAFAPETPRTVAQGLVVLPDGARRTGDTVLLHQPRERAGDVEAGGFRTVELVVNGRPVASREVPADGVIHDVDFEVPLARSSWVALRQFPQLHTNPVVVLVGGKPVRASRSSALWGREMVRRGWATHHRQIAPDEQAAARKAYDEAIEIYERIARESPED